MNKTLTEKWKDGELKEGEYYCKITESPYIERVHLPCLGDAGLVIEVLAPVPSYDECQTLENNCEILHAFWKGAKEKIDKLQEQLKEYEECLIAIRDRGTEKDFDCILSADIVLQKWGLK